MISLLIYLFSVVNNKDIIYCDIKGNVKNPGVYQMEEGEVINDLIERAGGLKKNSYVKNINLSKKVSDEMVVYILSLNEYEDLTYVCPVCKCEKKECNLETTTTKKEDLTTKVTEKIKINTTSETTTTKIMETTKKITTTESFTEATTKVLLININNAIVEDLVKLNGIGEKTALKIINYREENGKFECIEDIKNVSGIGDSLFAKIKDYITV